MLLGRAGLGIGMGDDFERDNFDYVAAAVAATPPAKLVVAPSSWLATSAGPFTSLLNPVTVMRGVPPPAPPPAAADRMLLPPPPPPPAATPLPSITLYGDSGPVPVANGAAISPPATPGPNWTTVAIVAGLGVAALLLIRRV